MQQQIHVQANLGSQSYSCHLFVRVKRRSICVLSLVNLQKD